MFFRRRASHAGLGLLLRMAWAAPCTAMGLALGGLVCAAGGRARMHTGVIEVSLRPDDASCGPGLRSFPFRAITFGHVVLAVTDEDQARCRLHERVHVQQYQAWGVFFLPAYVLSSAWQWLRGRSPYWDNFFEVEARRACAEDMQIPLDG